MAYSNFTIHVGNDTYNTITLGNEVFNMKSDTEAVTDYDELVNNYIDSMSTLTITLSENNLNVTFTPVTDTTLLNAVDNQDTYVRLQLMYHQASGCIGKSQQSPNSYNHPIWLEDDIQSRGGNIFGYVRRHSNKPEYYGITWLNLSKAQLQAGSATLTNIKSTYPPVKTKEGKLSGAFHNVRVEMFCPAIHRSHKDVFYYEREEGHRKISSNRVQFTSE